MEKDKKVEILSFIIFLKIALIDILKFEIINNILKCF